MHTAFANVTDLRTNMKNITAQAKDNVVILLKNGKPVFGLVNYEELKEFQEFKAQKEKSEAIRQSFDKIYEESRKLKLGENWLREKGVSSKKIKTMSDEDILDILEKEDAA